MGFGWASLLSSAATIQLLQTKDTDSVRDKHSLWLIGADRQCECCKYVLILVCWRVFRVRASRAEVGAVKDSKTTLSHTALDV
jgi:hypothetical protein